MLKKVNVKIPVAISNRHVHLAPEDIRILFEIGYSFKKVKELSQPEQYACEETVTLVGPRGVLEKVRVLGPPRTQSQVELSITDCFKLGLTVPVRDSGDLAGSAGIHIVGPHGALTLKEGCIIVARHIHMHTSEAQLFGLKNGDRVNVIARGPRALIFQDVLVRVGDKHKLEMHVDTDEGNAVNLKNGDVVQIMITYKNKFNEKLTSQQQAENQ